MDKFDVRQHIQFLQQYGADKAVKIASCYKTKFSWHGVSFCKRCRLSLNTIAHAGHIMRGPDAVIAMGMAQHIRLAGRPQQQKAVVEPYSPGHRVQLWVAGHAGFMGSPCIGTAIRKAETASTRL
jgi:hypothetical protein